jgi:P27 family predicted phage terminase small subunit
MNNQTTKTNTRPRPPDDLDGDALLKFHWVCDELEKLGSLATADSDLIVLYARTHAINERAQRHVVENGEVVKLPNGWPGENPYLRIADRTTAQLSKLYDQLGLSLRTRKPKADDGQQEFDF